MFHALRASRRPQCAAPILLICASAAAASAQSTVAPTVASTIEQPAIASSAASPSPLQFRVFLRDGTSLATYGEFAQVADRVVLSLPLGGSETEPALQVITIPAANIDWVRTEAYTHAVRADRYLRTSAEPDFAQMSREVAETLNQIAFAEDAAKRLELAESARRQLIDWPQNHFDYRADEINQMVTWLDQVVSDLRVAAGQSRVDLALVARATPPRPIVPLLAPPSGRERIEHALTAARLTTDAAARAAMYRAVLDALGPPPYADAWSVTTYNDVNAALTRELQVDRAYAELTKRMLARSDAHVRRADVRSLESLIRFALDEDRRLNHARPDDFGALLATLDARLDGVRRARLERDGMALRWARLQVYWRDVRVALDRLLGIRGWLVDVRQLAGPSPKSLARLADLAGKARNELSKIEAPSDTAAPHETLQRAAALAVRAADTRLEAVRTGQMDTAWQASSAAAGSLLLIEQAVAELRRVTYYVRDRR